MSTGALVTIISGTPGAGKTALAVSVMQEFLKKQPDRPVFVAGIKGLQLPHSPTGPVSEWTTVVQHPEDATISYPEFAFPDGSLVVLDEAQNFYRNRTAASRTPNHVAAMERHRHKGIDFILITQSPDQLDAAVRKLCGRYLHIRQMWSGRKLYEWPECVNPEVVGNRERATVSSYKLPKATFDLYTSSSLHVKQKRSIPKQVWILGIIVGVLGWGSYRIYDRVFSGLGESAAVFEGDSILTGAGPLRSASDGAVPHRSVNAVSIDDYRPRLRGRPESAPLYDGVRRVVAMPDVKGCVAMLDRCTCYTSQATDAFLSVDECREWLLNRPFNPYLADRGSARLKD